MNNLRKNENKFPSDSNRKCKEKMITQVLSNNKYMKRMSDKFHGHETYLESDNIRLNEIGFNI